MTITRKDPRALTSKIGSLFKMGEAATFKKGSAHVSAAITDRSIKKEEDGYGHAHYTCTLTVKFKPDKAKTSTAEIEALVNVSKEFYDQYEKSNTVNLEYAIEDPVIFMMEGE